MKVTSKTTKKMQNQMYKKKTFKTWVKMMMLTISWTQKKNKNLSTLKDFLNSCNNFLKDTIFNYNTFLDNKYLMELYPEDLLTLYFTPPSCSPTLSKLSIFTALMPVTRYLTLSSSLFRDLAKKIKLH